MNQPDTVSFWRGLLPHWEVVDGHYFVTLRLANSLPHKVAKELCAILSETSKDDSTEAARQYFSKIEHWLDSNHGERLLENAEIAAQLISTANHYQKQGYWDIYAMVVMPTHIHLIFCCGSLNLANVMRRYKKYTAREINRIMHREGKRVWQREWFDHWSRSAQEDKKIISYIRNNPVKAGLVKNPDDWPWTM